MQFKSIFIFSTVFIFTIFSASCTLPNAGGNNNNSAAAPPVQNSPAGGANAPGENSAPPTAPKASLPQNKTLDLQTNHANGSVLRVTAVNFSEDSIALDFAATNGYRLPIKLAQGRMQLRDDLGNVYNLSAPAQNPDIEVAPNNSLKGKLNFLGRIAPSAKSLTLTANYQYSSSSGPNDPTPYMVIADIPVERQ